MWKPHEKVKNLTLFLELDSITKWTTTSLFERLRWNVMNFAGFFLSMIQPRGKKSKNNIIESLGTKDFFVLNEFDEIDKQIMRK